MTLVGVGNSFVPLAVALVGALSGHAGALGLDLDRPLNLSASVDLGGEDLTASARADPVDVRPGDPVRLILTVQATNLLSADLGDQLRCSIVTPSGQTHHVCQGTQGGLDVGVLEDRDDQLTVTVVPEEPGRYDAMFSVDGAQASTSFQVAEPADAGDDEPLQEHGAGGAPEGQATRSPSLPVDGSGWADQALRIAGIIAAGLVVGLSIGAVVIWGMRKAEPATS